MEGLAGEGGIPIQRVSKKPIPEKNWGESPLTRHSVGWSKRYCKTGIIAFIHVQYSKQIFWGGINRASGVRGSRSSIITIPDGLKHA